MGCQFLTTEGFLGSGERGGDRFVLGLQSSSFLMKAIENKINNGVKVRNIIFLLSQLFYTTIS